MIRPFSMKLMRRVANDRGLSLVEVLAAMVVLALGVLGLAPMMAMSIQGSTTAEDITAVVVAAQQRIEQLIGLPNFGVLPYSTTIPLDGGKYQLTADVADRSVDNAIPPKVYKIDVTVDWVDDKGVDRTLTFTTFSTKP